MRSKCMPDLSARPETFTFERQMKASAEAIYKAWTERFDWWFAEPGELIMVPEIDRPFFFYNRKEWGRSPHYGRFLELVPNKLIHMTWVTPPAGTEGTETVIRVELTPNENGTHVRFTQSGFADKASLDRHEKNWPAAFDGLEEAIAKRTVSSAS
jgi:uncharacterized protein YndB with AHSA1/START domain